MAAATIESRVHKIIEEHLGVSKDEVTNDKNIVDDLGADELDFVELIMATEEEFGEAIPEDKAKSVHTVQDLINVVKEIKESN